MRKIALIVLAAAGIGLAGAASAADIARVYKKAPPPAPIWSWNGSYIGLFVGGAFADPSTSVPANAAGVPLFAGGPAIYDLESSVIAGYTSGYNWQFAPNWLLGYEGETGYIRMSGTGAYPGSPTTFANTKVGDIYNVWAARFGYVMDKSLLYVKGGAALARFESNVWNTANTLNYGSSKYQFSYAVGGGWEYAFDPKWSIKAEYLYLGFDSNSLAATGNSIGLRGGASQEFSTATLPGIHTAKVGLNYKWDWFGLVR